MDYTVVRAGSTLIVPVRLSYWSFIPALKALIKFNGDFSGLLGQLLFAVIATVTIFKRPADHAARALFLLGALLISVPSLLNIFISTLGFINIPARQWFSVVPITATYTVLFPAFLLRLSLVFPHPKPVVQRHSSLEYVPFLIALAVIPAFIVTSGTAGFLWTVIAIVATIAILIHSTLTMKDALSRAQLNWGLWGMIVSLLLFLLTYLVTFGIARGVVADFISSLSSLSFGVMGATLSIAILRYRLFEISLIIRRTLQYTVLTAVLGGVYFGGVLLFQQFFRTATGQASDLALVLSTLAIAALFNPLRQWIQRIVDQRFDRSHYNAEQILQRFVRHSRSQADLKLLSSQLVSTIQDTVQPESVSIWLAKEKGSRPMAVSEKEAR